MKSMPGRYVPGRNSPGPPCPRDSCSAGLFPDTQQGDWSEWTGLYRAPAHQSCLQFWHCCGYCCHQWPLHYKVYMSPYDSTHRSCRAQSRLRTRNLASMGRPHPSPRSKQQDMKQKPAGSQGREVNCLERAHNDAGVKCHPLPQSKACLMAAA